MASENFVSKMLHCYDTKKIQTAAEFVNQFLEHYKRLASVRPDRKTSYLNSVQRYLSEFKKKMSGRPNVPAQFLQDLKLSDEHTRELLREKRQRVHDASIHLVTLNGDQLIYDGRSYLFSDNKYCKLIALAVLTGRRCGELLFSARFSPPKLTHATHSRYWCRVTGLLKKRDKEQKQIEIPLLAPYTLISKKIQEVRSAFPCENQHDANIKYARSISNNVKKFAPDINNIHRCRNIYAALCFYYFNENKCSIARLAGDYLGHASVSATVLTYLNSNMTNLGHFDFHK